MPKAKKSCSKLKISETWVGLCISSVVKAVIRAVKQACHLQVKVKSLCKKSISDFSNFNGFKFQWILPKVYISARESKTGYERRAWS